MEQLNNEVLFWKVFHNIFIFKTIINKISEIEDDSLGYKEIDIDRTIKFKDIDSLSWMLEKQLFELIKCKLRAGEYMDISIHSITQLLDLKTPDSLTIQKEILELLAKKKRLELFDCDWLSIALNNCEYTHSMYEKEYIYSEQQKMKPKDTEIVKLVLSIFKDDIEVNESTLKWSLINSCPKTVELLIGFANFKLSENIQKSSLLVDANNNRRYKEQMIKLVLNSDVMFDPNSLPSSLCELDSLFSFKEKDVIDKILDLGLFSLSKKYTELFGDEVKKVINDNQQVDKIKAIHRIYSEHTTNNRKNFIKKYGKIENEEEEDEDDIVQQPTTITQSKNEPEIIKRYIEHDVRIELLSAKSKEEFESINKYISPTNKHKSSYPTSWSPVLISLQTWGLYSKILFSDKETIDWVFENVSNEMLLTAKLRPYREREIFQFETLELIEYAKLKSTTSKNKHILSFDSITKGSNFEKYVYQYTYVRAIENCDIETIKSIDQEFEGILKEYLSSYRNFKELVFNKDKISDGFQNLYITLDYLNSIGFKNFTPSYFKFFVESIFNIEDPNFDFSKVSINFNSHKETAISMLLGLFHDEKTENKMNTKGILFFFRNSGDFISVNQKELLRKISKSGFYDLYKLYYTYNYEEDYYYDYEEKEIEFNNSYYSIECLISLIKEFGKMDCGEDSDSIIHRNEIVNHLYSSLIQSSYCTLESIQHARDLILNKLSIPINHTVFHIIHYFSIKSQKLLKYILGQPFLSSSMTSGGENKYMADYDYEEFDGYNIGKLFDPLEFNYQYIFNTPFDQLLIKLIYTLSHGPLAELVSTVDDYQYKSYNHNLEYLLCIKREDLFFKELEYIEMELSKLQPGDDDDDNYDEFNISNTVYEYALKQMDSISFEKLVCFNSYKPFTHFITSPKTAKSFNNMKFGCLLKHIKSINQVIESQSIKLGNYGIWGKVSSEFDIIKTIIKFDLFGNENKLIPSNHNLEFLKKIDTDSSKYNIVLHQLLLKSFPNHPFLTITTNFIDTAVQFKKFNFLKYNYQNGYFKNDPSLLLHLKTKLSNENINWLI